jgi:hypothetical protein
MTDYLQCADVHTIGNAHSHIARNSAHYPAQCESNRSLKALSAKVLRRTLPRTLPAHCEITPRTLPAHCTPEIDTPRTLQKDVVPVRTWAPDNPFTCECGFKTGWLRNGKPLCPVCDGKAPSPAGAITKEGDCITYAKVFPGRCPLCGNRLDQDGGDCWHRSYHFGAEESTGAHGAKARR